MPLPDADLGTLAMSSSRHKAVTYDGGGNEGRSVLLHPCDKKPNTTTGCCSIPRFARSALCVLVILSFVLTCHGRPDPSGYRHRDLTRPQRSGMSAQDVTAILPGKSPLLIAVIHLVENCRV